MDMPLVVDREKPTVFRSRHVLEEELIENQNKVAGLFFSAPYPGNQKFSGHPTGLLYGLTVLADRKAGAHGRAAAAEALRVWCPDGSLHLADSDFEHLLIQQLRERQPKLVGISTFSVSYRNALAALKLIKRELPRTVVVFGGAHEDNFVDYYQREGEVDADFVIAGDGMFILDELYKIVEEHPNASVTEIKDWVERHRVRFSRVPGAGVLLYNHHHRLRKIYTKTHEFSRFGSPIALDAVPVMPRYLLVDEDSISRRFSAFAGQKTAQVMLGQGCPYRCPFCSEAIKRVWYETGAPRAANPIRHLDHVRTELAELKAAGYSAIFFDDSTLFAKPKPYMRALIRELGRLDFTWGGQTTQASIHTHAGLLGEMVANGLRYLYVGIEHFDGAMIDTFGKKAGSGNKFGRWSFAETLQLLSENGIQTAVSLTFGHPDAKAPDHATRETVGSVRFAIDRAAELADAYAETVTGVSLNLITYHPGTVISRQYEQKGLGRLNFTGHPNRRRPFTHFEEGIGPHAPGMTDALVGEIWRYARQKLGAKLYL